jgi:DNA-binding transcriptional ArsR family regulator
MSNVSGEADLSVVGSLFGDPVRARLLLALAGGRALSASMLAMESGASASAVSGHLHKLLDAGLVTVARQGRFRYYRLAGAHVAEVIEVMGRLAPARPIASMRAGTRANALRRVRRCYDHLAGRLGCVLTGVFIEAGHLVGHDGSVDFGRLEGAGKVVGAVDPVDYTLTDSGVAVLADLGGRLPGSRIVRCCVDWTEQRHHMAGAVGRYVLERFEHHDWVRPGRHPRVLTVTALGRTQLAARFGVDLDSVDVAVPV